MIEAEESVLQASPEATTREIVVALVHVQVARLKKLGRNDDALAAMRRLIRLDNGDTETLVETLQWLIEQQAWKVVDEAADRFAAVIAGDAVLSYAVAEAQLAQGRKSRAEELAAQALKLNAGKEIHAVYVHFAAAMSLQKRGLFAWAEKEYRYIMAVNAAVMPLAAYRLAEMEHDQGDDLAAGEVLQTAVTAAAANRPAPNSPTPNPSASLPELRSQMDYFFACHWETKGDKLKARQHLEKALAENPSDIDVLIACYRMCRSDARIPPEGPRLDPH